MQKKFYFLTIIVFLASFSMAQNKDSVILKKLINKDWALVKVNDVFVKYWTDIQIIRFTSKHQINTKDAEAANYDENIDEKWNYQDGYLIINSNGKSDDMKISSLDSNKMDLEYLDPDEGIIKSTFYDFRWLKKEDNSLAEEALKSNTKALYDAYLKKFPFGKYAELISGKSEVLEKETKKMAAATEWETVKKSTDEATLKAFIAKYEDSEYVE